MFRLPSLACGGDHFLDVTPLRCLFRADRDARGRLLEHVRYVDGPDTLFRLFRPAQFGARAQFQLIHELIDVFLTHDSGQRPGIVIAAHHAFAFARQAVLEVFCYLFNFFHGQRVQHGQRRGIQGASEETTLAILAIREHFVTKAFTAA